MARRRAEEALTCAGHPRQPQALLTSQRYLGHLATFDGRHTEAEHHLAEALALADRCAAPFERALTLVAMSDLRNATGQHDDSRALLDEARVTCARLHARPTLDRIDALETELAASRGIQPFDAVRLTVREIEILRLVATGKSNRKIADALYLSPRTVERHIANIYVKINVHNKVEATTYALRHLLV
jgi:DNA-binding CsgD family transcriptional regulator